MAFKLIWSATAREDLHEVVSFIAQDNRAVAESFGYLLMSKVDLLPQFPEMGRVVPEFADSNLREIVFRSYRIIYRVDPSKQFIAIARVWHGARGVPDIPSGGF